MSAQPNLAKAAAWYADKGWPVFPLTPRGKLPAISKDEGGNGLNDATTDLAIVGKWWADMPMANIGLAMGDASQLFTIDVDGEEGQAAWAALEAKHGAAPPTVEAETGHGRHLIFRKPPDVEIRNSVSRVGRGIDVRGSGGYIAAPPSIHPTGRAYRWKDGHRPNDTDVAEAPAWLLELVRKRESAPPPVSGHSGHVDAYTAAALANELTEMARTPEGRRNHQLNRASFNLGTLVGAGMIDRATVERSLIGAATAAGLSVHEATITIKSGVDAGIARPREIPDTASRDATFGLRVGSNGSSVGNNGMVGTEKPDMSILNEGRRDPPELPCDDDGPFLSWASWIREAAESKSTPPDYIATNLLAVAGSMIGTTRWARAWDGWDEPSVIFAANVGGPSWGKSPAFDSFKAAIDAIETDLASDYPDKLRAWERDVEAAKAHKALWQIDVKEAVKGDLAPPDMPEDAVEPDKPPRPRIVVNDSTPEELGVLLAATPRGLLFQRDELSGWLLNFDRYAGGGERQFWIEAFGGRSYVIDRKQHSGNPVIIPHLAVSVAGGVQPDKLNSIFLGGDDDGLTARFLLCWPDRVQPRRPGSIARQQYLTDALRRLRKLPVTLGGYVAVPLTDDAAQRFQEWRETDYLKVQDRSAGRFAGHVGKMPSFVLRQALILEFLWWSVTTGKPEPAAISRRALVGAIGLVQHYYLPMAERCYGDAALPDAERHAAAIGRWIQRTRPDQINARELRREHRADVPGLPNDGEAIKAALGVLVDAQWLAKLEQSGFARNRRGDFQVNPMVFP
jgi:hypothetical protein